MVDWIKKTDESGLAKFENMQLMLSKAVLMWLNEIVTPACGKWPSW